MLRNRLKSSKKTPKPNTQRKVIKKEDTIRTTIPEVLYLTTREIMEDHNQERAEIEQDCLCLMEELVGRQRIKNRIIYHRLI